MGFIKNIKREINKRHFNNEINKIISQYKYVHIMYNDKFNKPFVDLTNKYFGNKDHLFLIKRSNIDSKVAPFPEYSNVYEYIKLDGIKFFAKNIEKLIFHSLFEQDWVEYLYKNKDLLNKSYWVMWGGDLYNPPRDEKNDYVRKNFKGYLNDIDKEYALNKYGMSDNFFKVFYNFPISKEMLDNTKQESKDYVKIQINNSCNKSTLEVLDMLSKFKDEKIHITTVLSYGKYMKYKEPIIQKGKELFGEKFEYIEDLMPPADYANYLAQNDILILNQRQQQAVGNTLASLYLGKKVFIREEIPTNKYLNNEGIKIFNTNDIPNMSFEDFTEYSNSLESKNEVEKYYDDKYLVSLLEDVFND